MLGIPWLLRKDSSESSVPSSVIRGSWDTAMADRKVSLALVWSSEMDGMSMTSGCWTMAVEVLLVRPSHFLIFLIAFVCIFLMVDVVMVSTARWKWKEGTTNLL